MTGPQTGAWGRLGYPLLPSPFRDVRPISDRLKQLTGCLTASELDASFWLQRSSISADALDAVAAEATKRAASLGTVSIGSLASPDAAIAWPVGARTRKLYEQLARTQTADLTIEKLLSQPGSGIRTTLDLLAANEIHRSDTNDSIGQESRHLRSVSLADSLRRALSEPHINRLVSSDLRLGASLRGSDFASEAEITIKRLESNSTTDVIKYAEALVATSDRAAVIVSQTLDQALGEVIALFGSSPKNSPAVLARFGLHGDEPTTLNEASQIIGVSRERVRQIEKKFTKRVKSRVWFPQLEAALQVVQQTSIAPEEEVPRILIDSGLAHGAITFRTLQKFAGVIGLSTDLHVVDGLVGTSEQHEASRADRRAANETTRAIRRVSRPHGFVHEAVLSERLSEQGQDIDRQSLLQFVAGITGSTPLPEGWWWLPPLGSELPTVVIHALKIAVVAGRPFTCRDLRGALLRLVAYRGAGTAWAHPAPPSSAVKAWAQIHPDIEWDEEQQTMSLAVDDPNVALGESEWALVDILSASPGGIATREQVLRAGVEMGFKLNTLSVYLSFNTVVEQVEHNVWGLRGAERDTQELDILRAVTAKAPRPDRRAEEITKDGVLIMYQLSINDIAAPVIYFSAAAQEILPDRLEAVDSNGRSHGEIRIDGGQSWGYKPFLRSTGAEDGDVISVEVNVSNATATLSLDEGPT